MKHKPIYYFMLLHCIILEISATPKNYHMNLWASYNDLQGRPLIARKQYEKLLTGNDTASAYFGYIQHLFKHKQYRTILSLMPKLDPNFDNQRDIQLIFAQALEFTGKKKEAEERFIKIGTKHKDHPESVYFAAGSLVRQHRYKQALSLIDEFLNSTIEQPSSSIFYLLKAQIYLMLHNQPMAMNSIKKATELNPRLKKDKLFGAKIKKALQRHALNENIHEVLEQYLVYDFKTTVNNVHQNMYSPENLTKVVKSYNKNCI